MQPCPRFIYFDIKEFIMFGNNFKNRITRSITADAAILALATMAHATNVACVGNSITEGYGV